MLTSLSRYCWYVGRSDNNTGDILTHFLSRNVLLPKVTSLFSSFANSQALTAPRFVARKWGKIPSQDKYTTKQARQRQYLIVLVYEGATPTQLQWYHAFFFLTLMRTTSAASIATSVPVPIAIPTLAIASAGESLIPSPTMATRFPSSCNCFTLATLWEGRTSANTLEMPTYGEGWREHKNSFPTSYDIIRGSRLYDRGWNRCHVHEPKTKPIWYENQSHFKANITPTQEAFFSPPSYSVTH